jgi:hypothetical protein
MGINRMADGQSDRQKRGEWTILSVYRSTRSSNARQRARSMDRGNEMALRFLFFAVGFCSTALRAFSSRGLYRIPALSQVM